MGIQGLLPFLKDASEAIHIRRYKGCTVGVDTYCWIHRGAVACAAQLAKGEAADHYVRYCLKYVNMLRSLGIKPVLVFDGRNLPAKAGVEESRRERREKYSRKGRELLREGKASEARDCFVKCINVTPEMALDVMKAARSLDVDCIVAPYEADAQLAYLQKNGIVQAVITEDSDLIAFGCKKVIFKLDLAGNCMEIDSTRLNLAMKVGEKFTPEKFRYMCIIAGCDYLPSLPGIGIGKARKLFQLTANPDILQVIKRMAITLKMKSTVTPEYVEGFQQANNTFLYQLAFDPRKRKLQPLNPYPPELEPSMLCYAGRYVDEEKAYQMALGNLNFNTMQRMCDFHPDIDKPYNEKTPTHRLSIWHRHFLPGPGLEQLGQEPIEREGTKGREVTVEVKQRMVQKKRQREEEDEVKPPSDDQLSTLYTAPAAVAVVPDTPDKAEEREEAKPAKRNRFATKLMAKKTKANILGSGEVVTSRFFQSKKLELPSHSRQGAVVKREPEEKEEGAEKENQGGAELNTSGLLEGIADIEMEQEKEYRMDREEECATATRDMKTEDTPVFVKKETNVSASIDTLQRFHRSHSAPVIARGSKQVAESKSKGETSMDLVSRLECSQESQGSVISVESSSQGSVYSVSSTNTYGQSPSSQQRAGTPRPRSAFAWSRKQELTGKKTATGDDGNPSKQSKLTTLTGFAFKPTNQMKLLPRSSSSINIIPRSTPSQERGGLGRAGSPVSQDSLSQTLFLSTTSSSSSIPGSMDMARLGEEDSNSFMDSQSSWMQSQDTSSVSLTFSQESLPLDPPLPSLCSQSGGTSTSGSRGCTGGGGGGVEDGDVKGQGGDAEVEEQYGSKRLRRTGLSRKSKIGKSSSSVASSSSSPDTDALSLTPSPPSPDEPLHAERKTVDHGETLATGLLARESSLSCKSSPQTSTTPGVQGSATVRNEQMEPVLYMALESSGNGEDFPGVQQSQLTRGQPSNGMDRVILNSQGKKSFEKRRQSDSSGAESENIPPHQGKALSPSKSNRNLTLLGARNIQATDNLQTNGEGTKKSTNVSKKSAAVLGPCKPSGLSKKRRSSGKPKSDATPKGQTSLLAFMSKPKNQSHPAKQREGNSPMSPSRTGTLTDLTPELETSLQSRHTNITTKRNIFES